MVKVQFTLKEETLKELKVFMAQNDYKTYQEAIDILLWLYEHKIKSK